jgi:RNA polymerase sigma-70 factor (ECF subfamily)
MFYSKSIAFGDEGLSNAAAAQAAGAPNVEAAFIERLKEGDAEAFDRLVTRYSSAVYSLLLRLTSDREEAADLAQDTFLQVLRSIRKFRGDSELKTWIFRIAINESRNRFRWWARRRRSVTTSLDAAPAQDARPFSESLASTDEAPDQALVRRENEARLELALRGLSRPYREVIVLCDVEGESYQEIARILGLNIGTVKSRIARGRDQLRKLLTDF